MDNSPRIDDFLSDINPNFAISVQALHQLMTGLGCEMKLQEAKSGHVVSYTHPESKKVLANFVSRKSGPVIRIYGDHVASYTDYLETLPDKLEAKIAKAGSCRRLLDPTKCNARCPMGYDFILKGTRHQKCRYNCFMLPVNDENQPWIQGILEREMKARSA